jgi:hypothetical protein
MARPTRKHPEQVGRAVGGEVRDHVPARRVRLQEQRDLADAVPRQHDGQDLAQPGDAVPDQQLPQQRRLGLDASVLVVRAEPVGGAAELLRRHHDHVVGLGQLADRPGVPVPAGLGRPDVEHGLEALTS